MATNYSKWINVAIAAVVVLALSVCTFTDRASAAVINSYAIISNNRDINTSVSLSRLSSSSSVITSDNIDLGKCTIDGVFYSDFIFNASYQRSNGNFLLNFNYKPMYAKYDSDTSVFKISEFSGFTISFYLPQYNSSANNYTTTYEWVPLTIGGNYGTNYSNLFLTQYKPSVGVKAYNWTSSDYTFHHFAFEWSDDNINETFNGAYSAYSNADRFRYLCQTLDRLLGFDASIKVKTSVAFDINYFPDVLSYAEKAQLEKLDNISGDLDELLNSGSGQFDDTKDQMQDASDKAELGNQDIQNNAPKPDINDTVNDTSDVIDEALSGESFDKISDLLSAIFANTLISTILLISVAVGAVKYIFFGKG